MESGDLINLPASSSSGNGSENIRSAADCEPRAADSAPTNSDVNEEQLHEDFLGNEGDFGNNDSQSLLVSESEKDLIKSTNIVQVSAELAEVEEKINCFSSAVHNENGSSIRVREKDRGSISGLKRTRETLEEQHPSVSVLYNSLPSGSKRKLEKLLQEWSEWHARHYRSSADSNEVLESGEDMYFPALYVGVDKPSPVSFWMDNQTRDPQSKEVITLDRNSVPLYDRGFALGLTPADGSGNLERGLELGDASRCFNCSSYNHSLKECPKPRDNAAVNNARKQQKSRRNQNATSSRNPTRYYQSSPGGKYDGLKPGSLDAETQKLLGLGELDPPPWLNRMREIGYPPGYLDPEDEDQPSGITIFAEEESKEEKEDGEILDTELILDTEDTRELPRKKSVKFPGINAPIPENADERRWTAGHSSHDLSRSQSNRRFNPSSEPSRRYYQEQRWTKDYRDDGPPGVDPITSPLVSSYPPRYGSYDSSSLNSYSPRGNNLIPRSPSFERPLSDRGRRSLIVYETDYGRWSDDFNSLDSSSHHYKDRRDQHYHHSRR